MKASSTWLEAIHSPFSDLPGAGRQYWKIFLAPFCYFQTTSTSIIFWDPYPSYLTSLLAHVSIWLFLYMCQKTWWIYLSPWCHQGLYKSLSASGLWSVIFTLYQPLTIILRKILYCNPLSAHNLSFSYFLAPEPLTISEMFRFVTFFSQSFPSIFPSLLKYDKYHSAHWEILIQLVGSGTLESLFCFPGSLMMNQVWEPLLIELLLINIFSIFTLSFTWPGKALALHKFSNLCVLFSWATETIGKSSTTGATAKLVSNLSWPVSFFTCH